MRSDLVPSATYKGKGSDLAVSTINWNCRCVRTGIFTDCHRWIPTEVRILLGFRSRLSNMFCTGKNDTRAISRLD